MGRLSISGVAVAFLSMLGLAVFFLETAAAASDLDALADSLTLASAEQGGGGDAGRAAGQLGGGTALPILSYTVSGYVQTPDSAAVAGVAMLGLPGEPDTSAAGLYTGTVDYGWSGTVTPAKPGWVFTPVSTTYSFVTADQLYQNYTAEGVGEAVVYVDIDQTANPETGDSWATAFNTIQEGVDAAFDAGGGEVWVAEGTYTSTGDAVVLMREYVHLYGGFAGVETALDQRDWEAYPTIIGGEYARRCVVGANRAALDGFTLAEGNAGTLPAANVFREGLAKAAEGDGGGMVNPGTSPEVFNCVFSGNVAASGGGMYNYLAAPMVVNCVFWVNIADDGGAAAAAAVDADSLLLAAGEGGGGAGDGAAGRAGGGSFANVLAYSAGAGGGMCNEASWPAVVNCTFWGNTAKNGGGVYNYQSDPGVTNCIFAANIADTGEAARLAADARLEDLARSLPLLAGASGGGGAGGATGLAAGGAAQPVPAYDGAGGGMCNDESSPAVMNCTFWDNEAGYGGGMYNRASSPDVTNTILWGDLPEEVFDEEPGAPLVTYSDVQGGYPGAGNIDADPLFTDPGGGNLCPAPGSPCIDTGTEFGAPDVDIYWVPRPQCDGYDMGACESTECGGG